MISSNKTKPLPTAASSDTRPGPTLRGREARISAVRQAINANQKTYMIRCGRLNEAILVDAEALGRHLTDDKTPYLPYLVETIEQPQEIWRAQYQHKETNSISLLFIRRVIVPDPDGDKDRGLLFVVEEHKGVLMAKTFYPFGKVAKNLPKKRQGELLRSEADEQ